MDLTPFTPDCGHTVTPVPGSVGTGKATDPNTGKTMCYPCAEAAEREAIKTADVYTAYVTNDGKRLTTWTGAELAKITNLATGSKVHTKNGWYCMRTVHATTPDGATWYGRGSDDADVITIRRNKRG
jgi:hypothetical protein